MGNKKLQSIGGYNRDAVIDVIDERDYIYDEVFGVSGWPYPDSKIIDDWEVQNQWLEEITKYMCVYYSSSHGTNIENFLEKSWVKTTWKALWLEAIKKEMLDSKRGTSLSNWPRLLKELWYITGWTLITSLDSYKDSICNNRPVNLWSNKINWEKTSKAPYYAILGSSYWHWFIWIGYNDEKKVIICKNSYWDGVFDDWIFYIPYSAFNVLLYQNKYSLIDKINGGQAVLDYKQSIVDNINLESAKEGYKKGIWNWLNPRQPASRQEVVTMLMRGLELNNNKKW